MTDKENTPVIKLANVSKLYHTYPTPRHRLLEIISGGRKRYSRETRALDDVSFSLVKGGRLGIVGENGSGKSTLLKVLAGVLTPTTGTVDVRGRVSALLELGAGFNPELPGQENIRQFCMLHGMHRDEIDAALPEIIKFSELRDAIEHPVKTYSSGMAVRLGFACAVYVQPDILIVDEALSVGDAYFQNKCLHKIRSMLDQGITFIYVTHAADAIRSLCNEGIWLEKGKFRLAGTSTAVGAAYQSEVFSRMVRAGLQGQDNYEQTSMTVEKPVNSHVVIDDLGFKAFKERVEPLRSGSGEIRIDNIVVVDDNGFETDSIPFDVKTRVRVFFHVESKPPAQSALTLGITDSSGKQLLHFSSASHSIYASSAPSHIPQVIEFTFMNPLNPGEYGLVAGIGVLTEHPQNYGQTLIESLLDYCAGGARFSVRFPNKKTGKDLWGVVHTNYSVSSISLD
ncbi:MAG: ABC transporter ATP-binding protein [Methylococcaceae bacterium]